MPAVNSSSSPAAEPRLVRVPITQVRPHPANANVMDADRRATLARNISRQGRYPPLVARPHPDDPDAWQLLDGHQRLAVLQELGHAEITLYPWPCDDATALLLLATLNRLEGADVPAQRAALLAELQRLLPPDALEQLLPENADQLAATLALRQFDTEALLAELAAAADHDARAGPRLISFAVAPEDEGVIEAAVARAAAALTGRNKRGRALARVCAAYVEGADA